MRVVLDTNIVFSAILNTNSRISGIILKPKSKINFYSTEQLKIELEVHKDKIAKLSNYNDVQLERIITIISSKIRFINPKLISKRAFDVALKLTRDVDIDDTEFVALAEHIKGKLWTGDKNLQRGLVKKNWNRFISTQQLFEITSDKKK